MELCLLYSKLWPVAYCSSLMTFLLIGLDRSLAILKPIYHRIFVTKWRIFIAVIFSWLLAVLFSSIWFVFEYKPTRPCSEKPCLNGALYHTIYSIFIMLFVINTILYVSMYIKAKQSIHGSRSDDLQMHDVGGNSNTVENQVEQQTRASNQKQMKLIRVFLIMYLGFAVGFCCFIGYIALALKHQLEHSQWKVRLMQEISFILFGLSSSVNPTLTLTMRKDFRIRCVWFR